MKNAAAALARLAQAVSTSDAKRIVEIACLAVVSDGLIAPAEAAIIRALPNALAAPLGAALVDGLIRDCVALGDRDVRLEHLRSAGAALTSEEARAIAYRIALLTALADQDDADQEFEFDLDLQDALELSPANAERLAGEVRRALSAE